jgi:type IV pilus assembly protein PilF
VKLEVSKALVTTVMLLVFGLSGCQTTGVRPGGMGSDTTGSLGQAKRTGAGDVYVRLAVAYMQKGKMGEALKNGKKGVALDPNNGEAHNVLAIIHSRIGENALADKHFKRAKKLQPKNPYTLNAYGSFLCGQKKYKEADVQFKEALKNPLYKTPEVALTNAGICARQHKDLDLAEGYLRRALQHNKQFPVALIQMAKVSYETGDMEAARDFLNRYHNSAQSTAESLWLGVQIEQKLGNRNAVADYSMQLKGRFPDSSEVQMLKDSLGR